MELQKNCFNKKISLFTKIILHYRFELMLLLLTIIGLGLKIFYLFFRFGFQSDNVFAGLSSMEFWKYNNYFFSYYYVPSDDSNILEVIVFHLIPQILSNYDPAMLKIMTFIIFLLIVITFSYLVFYFTKSLLNALFFSALLSNWYIHDSTILWITSHDSTIFFIGILLILYFCKPVKNWELIFLLILASVTFTDSLILIWFTIPLLFAILLSNISKQQLRKRLESFLRFDLSFKIIFISGIVMIFKKFFIEYYVSHAHVLHCRDLECLINTQIKLFLESLTILLNSDIHGIIFKNNQISFIDILFVIFLISYVILLIKNLKSFSNKIILFFFTYFGIMFMISSLFYSTTAFALQTQYLKFILICVLSIFCLIDFSKSKYAKWLLLGIIIFNLFYVAEMPLNTTISPNDEHYQLIDFLKKSNLSFGYGDYWDSNIITYLSHEDVIIRPVWIENGLEPRYWNSAKRWYETVPDEFFVIVSNTNEKALNYYKNYNVLPEPFRIIDYKNYKIFVYNTSDFDIQNRIFDAIKLFHSGGEQRYDPLILGSSWYADKDLEGYIIYGPYVSLPDGNYRVTYMIRLDPIVSRNASIAKLEIFDNRILKQIVIYNSDFLNTSTYQAFTLDFTSQNNKNLEYRVYKYSNSTLFISNISIKKVYNTCCPKTNLNYTNKLYFITIG